MNDDPEQLKILVQSFVDDPHESLAVELKEWLDPRDPKDQMQLVRTLLAFRNHADGGLLLLGIDDSKTHKPPPAGWDVRQVYSDDHIQRLVSRYASHKFDIRVLFARHGSYEYPAIVVSGGILTPVACKSDLRDPAEPNRYLLKEHDVYVRTLNTNGTVSSAKATWQDLEALVNLCSSNREANSVGFFTKLFQNLQTQDLSEILKNLSNLSEKAIDTIEGIAQLHSEGEQRFSALAEEQNVPIAGRGFFDVVLVIQGKTSEKWEADERFRSTLEVANPNLRGFPVLKVRPPHQPDTLRQQVIGEVWEQFLYLPIAGRPSSIGVLEFMILDREGRFFFRRVLEEDNDFMTELSSQGSRGDQIRKVQRRNSAGGDSTEEGTAQGFRHGRAGAGRHFARIPGKAEAGFRGRRDGHGRQCAGLE